MGRQTLHTDLGTRSPDTCRTVRPSMRRGLPRRVATASADGRPIYRDLKTRLTIMIAGESAKSRHVPQRATHTAEVLLDAGRVVGYLDLGEVGSSVSKAWGARPHTAGLFPSTAATVRSARRRRRRNSDGRDCDVKHTHTRLLEASGASDL